MARALALIALAAAALAAGAAPARPAGGCSRTVGASADVQQLVRSLPVGAVACLHGGVYHGRLVVDRPLTLRGAQGAAIDGGITIDPGATGSVISGLVVHGSGRARAAVLVHANGVRILHNRIAGPGFHNLNTACVYLDGARDAVVDGNKLGSCTRATRANLSAPGVFVGSAYAARVTNNVIAHTVGVGIVLGPNAQHSFVLHNIVDSSTGGVEINGNRRSASSYNVVRNNIFSNARGPNVVAVWGGVTGKKNAVVANCLWRSIGPETQAPGVLLDGNLVADPRYQSPPSSYAITGGPCAGKRPSIVPLRLHSLPAFRVDYRLRATAARVQVVSLGLRGVAAGARVAATCTSGCSVHWSGRAHGSDVVLSAFAGSSLPVGAAIAVRVTKPGYAGAYARVVVTGLPDGMRIEHACLAPGGSSPVPCSRFH